jgi:hypothetical protein
MHVICIWNVEVLNSICCTGSIMPRERWCSDSIVECCCSKPSKPSKCEFKSHYHQKIKIKYLAGCWALHIPHSFSLPLSLKIYFHDTVISIRASILLLRCSTSWTTWPALFSICIFKLGSNKLFVLLGLNQDLPDLCLLTCKHGRCDELAPCHFICVLRQDLVI